MKLILWICLLFTSLPLSAEEGFLYIEGLRNIPFKVSIDGIEVKMFGEGYLLWPYTVGGYRQVSIRLDNNQGKPQLFYLQLVDGGSYGFQFLRSVDDNYYLKDLIKEGKIMEANLPNSLNKGLPNTGDDNRRILSADNQPVIIRENSTVLLNNKTLEASKQPQQTNSLQAESVEKVQSQKIYSSVNDAETSRLTDIHTDTLCVENVKPNELQRMIRLLAKQSDDESKMTFLQRQYASLCFNAVQLKQLGLLFDTQYGRYTFSKAMYLHCSDVEHYTALSSLFLYADYRERFLEWVQHPSTH